MSGGAGATGLFGSCLIIISPGAGGAGGFKYLTAISCIYSSLCFDLSRAKENQLANQTKFKIRLENYLLFKISGHASSFIGYSHNGKSPFQVHTSHLLAQIPRLPRADISWVSFIFIGSDDLSIAFSISLKNEAVCLLLAFLL